MTKNFGTPVSGYLDPTGRAWETVVFEAGKPVLDTELNLTQDIDSGMAQDCLRKIAPSGWLMGDPVGSSDPTFAFFGGPITTSNLLRLKNSLKAVVNGWPILVQHTQQSGNNLVDLGAGPSGAGSKRTDLVFLEVWRRLIQAAPSTVGKSASARIWQNGNVATDPTADLSLNYVDDTLDTDVGAETTSRVQIQYRLRVVNGVNLFTYASGMDDPTVVANSVPVSAGAPNGVSTLFPYVNQSTNGDGGLWRAGDGDPANTLGTVDGFMYAIPLTGVFRRNTTAFSRLTNLNGGNLYPAAQTRPDGLWSDVVDASDLADLRNCVSLEGWDLSEVLSKNVNYLLDNTLRTEIVDSSPDGGGCQGPTVLRVNEIGPSASSAGPLIGQFDSIRRRFTDRGNLEVTTVVVNPTGGTWVDGVTALINPGAMTVYPYPAFNWSSMAPSGVQISDVLDVRWASTTNTNQSRSAQQFIANITGLGSSPAAPVTITFGTISFLGLTTEPLYVTLLISYPAGQGMSHTPIPVSGGSTQPIDFVGAAPSAASPVSYASLSPGLDPTHREAVVEYLTSNLTFTVKADFDTPTIVRVPERVYTSGTTSVTVNASARAFTLDNSQRVLTLSGSVSAGDTIVVTYKGLRPMTHVGTPTVAIYFRSVAPQSSREELLTTSLHVVPRVLGQSVYTITTGSGSPDEGYPFPQAYVQTGGIFPGLTGTFSGEHELMGSAQIQLHDFDANTGLLTLPIYVPFANPPEALVFTRNPGDADVEDRTFFTGRSASGYLPNVYAQNLASVDRHKNIFFMLCSLGTDSVLGVKGQLVLVALTRYAKLDASNSVFMDSDLNISTTTAAVYRVKGNILTRGVNS